MHAGLYRTSQGGFVNPPQVWKPAPLKGIKSHGQRPRESGRQPAIAISVTSATPLKPSASAGCSASTSLSLNLRINPTVTGFSLSRTGERPEYGRLRPYQPGHGGYAGRATAHRNHGCAIHVLSSRVGQTKEEYGIRLTGALGVSILVKRRRSCHIAYGNL